MEKLEIHPVHTKVVCINQPHLKHMWIIGSLTSQLGCFYNPHQPQVINMSGLVRLPTTRITKIKGHVSQIVTSSESSEILTNIQMGTYLVFLMPKKTETRHSCHLVINGIESILKGTDNPSEFILQLVTNEENKNEETNKENSQVSRLCNLFNNNKITNDQNVNLRNQSILESSRLGHNNGQDASVYPLKAAKTSYLDFQKLEVIKTIAEEELGVSSDSEDDDASEDIHQVVRRRLVIDISDMISEREKYSANSGLITLFLRPTQPLQAWQFLSSWVTVSLKNHHETTNTSSSKPNKKRITRAKPISPTATLKKTHKISNIINLTNT